MPLTIDQLRKLRAVGDANATSARAIALGTPSEVIIANAGVRIAELEALDAGVPKGRYRRYGGARYIAAQRQFRP